MTQSLFAACIQLRNIAVCGLLTLTLTACGSDGGSSGAATASDAASAAAATQPLVSPNVGVIDRSQEVASTDSGATPAKSSSPSMSSTGGSGSTDSSSTTASGSGSGATTVAANKGAVTGSAPSASLSTGTATLDWSAPTENSDGSVLTNLAGYTVYYGTSASSMTQSVKITNPGLTAYTMTNLPAGTWYFTITSYSSSGLESARSGVISARI